MKAYNETWITNRAYNSSLINWQKIGLLSDTEFQATQPEFPDDFYKPNWWIRIGLFLISCFAISSVSGIFFAMFGLMSNETAWGISMIIFGMLIFAALEYMIKKQKLYRSGIDNALLYSGLGFLFTGFLTLTSFDYPSYFYPLFVFILLMPALIRYSDPLVAIGVFISLFAFIFLVMNTFAIGAMILPFVLMAMAAGVYFVAKKWKDDLYYAASQYIIESLSLVVFYLAGNYFVVREANAMLNNQLISAEIPFSFLFWVFTFAIPALFIYKGIKHKERNAIVIGLLAFAFSIFTYRHYFSIMPIEWALTVGGLFLILFAIFALKYFKTSRFNLSAQPQEADKYQKLEALLVSQAFQTKPADDSMKFGGGDFGGGGAAGQY